MPVYSVEAPVGGWNARDSQDNIPESDALELVNLIPSEGYVKSRGGIIAYFSTTLAGNAMFETLIPYSHGGSSEIVWCGGGQVGSSGTSLTEDRWQWAVTHGRIILVNGSDAPQEYSSSTLSAISGIGGSGLTVSDLIGVMPFKGRVFYWEDNATSFWYPGAGEYKNASMSEYEMNQFLTKGGHLVLGFSWTLDGGAGMDDLACFVFSSGEVLVYQGSDPGSASDWALVGRFEIGEPLGRRAHCRLGSDHVILTKDGYELISYSLQTGTGLSKKLSDKIGGAVREAIDAYGDNEGWEVFFYSAGSLLIVNIPVATNTTYVQHVLNMNTNAWCKWNINAITFAEGVSDGLGGGDRLWASTRYNSTFACYSYYDPDRTLDTGNDGDGLPVECYATQITNFRQGSVKKQLTGINFITTFQAPSAIEVTTAPDFNTPAAPTPSETANNDSEITTQQWKILAESGYAVSYRVGISSGVKTPSGNDKPFKWYATQMTYKVGGPV